MRTSRTTVRWSFAPGMVGAGPSYQRDLLGPRTTTGSPAAADSDSAAATGKSHLADDSKELAGSLWVKGREAFGCRLTRGCVGPEERRICAAGRAAWPAAWGPCAPRHLRVQASVSEDDDIVSTNDNSIDKRVPSTWELPWGAETRSQLVHHGDGSAQKSAMSRE